jgi:murein DD-endopeptidase MepM/ murein hydrolase activator NlpD
VGLSWRRKWEVQFHPASGGEVRRWFVPQVVLLLTAAACGAVLVGMGALVALLPLSARAATTKLSAGPVQRQNSALHRELAAERERAGELVARVEQVLQRGRRLAWVLGALEAVRSMKVAPPPPASAGADELSAWLERHSEHLSRLGDLLGERAETPQECGLLTLPTAPPVEPSRAVPVAAFGWHVSPFTGRDEAHHGVTLAAPVGEVVRAPGAGRVVYAGRPGERRANEWMRWGTVVVVDHGCSRMTVFGHLGALAVRSGSVVQRGQRLGLVGESGWTRVPALYWEVRWPLAGTTRPIDPALVALWLRLDDLDARFEDPAGGLPASFSPLESLRLAR